jgi:gamma-glutamyltranspeptidase/glutathione hydrolase
MLSMKMPGRALLAALLLTSACAPMGQMASTTPQAAPAPAPADGVPVGEKGWFPPPTRAAEAGVDMLRLGGTATDAAIATMLALTVVEPQSSGIGGGGFLVLGDAAGKVETVDGRETAPKAAGPQWFYVNGQPLPIVEAIPGGRSVGVPGNLRLAALAHAHHGKLAWRALFQPAIRWRAMASS